MPQKYSVILCTLKAGGGTSGGGDVWENPREVLETIAEAGYDGVDLDAEPERIEPARFNEVRQLVTSLGLKVPALIGAWAMWHAGELRDLASRDQATCRRAIEYAKKSIDLAATFDDPPCLELCACPAESEYPVFTVKVDRPALSYKIGARSGHAVSKIDGHTVLKFSGHPQSNGLFV